MRDFIQLLVFIVIGVALIWFGFTFFMRQWEKARRARLSRQPRQPNKGSESQESCPICTSKLNKGDLVKTLAFPSITGGKDRLMHIRGCAYCIDGGLDRNCPVCGASLELDDILVARIFERPHRKPHVHIAGCNKCRRTGKL